MVKLSDSEAEASETQTWLEFAVECGYLETEIASELYREYDRILGKLVNMINRPEPWLLPNRKN
jgi:four helix bundle protein